MLAIDLYNIFSSVYFMAVMSIDRYLVVLATVHSHGLPCHTHHGAKVASLCVWLAMALLVLPFFSFVSIYSNELWPEFPTGQVSLVQGQPYPYTGAGLLAACVRRIVLYADLLCWLWAMQLYSGAKVLGKAKHKVIILVFAVLADCLLC